MISRRDWFAGNCPDWWMEESFPRTIGEIRDTLIARGILVKPRSSDVLKSYNNNDTLKLKVAIAYEYADAMLEKQDSTKELK